MYQTTNYLEKKRHSNPPFPRVSSVAPRWSNPFAFPSFSSSSSPPDQTPAIPHNQTMPSERTPTTTEAPEIQRSHSAGGFFMQRKRSTEERRVASSVRAAELMAQYEMADEEEKQDSLVRKADFKSMTMPSLGASMANTQAMLAQAQKAKKEAQLKDVGLTKERNQTLGRAKAANLMSEFESSEDREESLNRAGSFPRETTPSLASSLSGAGLHKAAFAKNRPVHERSLQESQDIFRARSFDTVQEDTSQHSKFFERTDASSASTTPSASQFKSRSFDAAKPVKKSRAQQRIDKARATRMRIVSEMAAKADKELPSEVGIDVVPLSSGSYTVKSTTDEGPQSPRSVVSPRENWRVHHDDHLLC